MRRLEGLSCRQRYNEQMGCMKGCLDYLGVDVSFPWLYGATGHAFVVSVNDTVFVDAAHEWDTSMVFDLAPNLGFTVERFGLARRVGLAMSDDEFRRKQREAYDFVRERIDRGLPCYGWELAYIPSYYVITGYDDSGYSYSGPESSEQAACPWDKLGTFDVKRLQVSCLHPTSPAPDDEAIRLALEAVLNRVEHPDGWSIEAQYRSGPEAYTVWADALETGRANRDGEAYINQVWLECRQMAVEFLIEAKRRVAGRCDAAFDEAIAHYGATRDHLSALAALHPERPGAWDWTSTVSSPEGAQILHKAEAAERQGIVALRGIVQALR